MARQLKTMSKSRDYYRLVEDGSNYAMTSETQRAMRLKGTIVAKEMNHKMIEDIKELIFDIETIQSEGTNLWVHQARLLIGLEKLKL